MASKAVSKKKVAKLARAVVTKAKKAVKAEKKAKTVEVMVELGIGKTVKPVYTGPIEIVNSPVKPRRMGGGGGGKQKYPFATMEVGQAFFTPSTISDVDYTSPEEFAKAQKEDLDRISGSMASAVRRYTTSAKDGRKFSTLRMVNGLECGFNANVGVGVYRDE